MRFAGIDVSSRAVDVVLLEADADCAMHVRRRLDFDTGGALERIRRIRDELPPRANWHDLGVVAVWIERPMARGNMRGQEPLLLAIGAILAMIPRDLPLHLARADDWRKTLGLPIRGRRDTLKRAALVFAAEHWLDPPSVVDEDAADAFCIAYACRKLEQAA